MSEHDTQSEKIKCDECDCEFNKKWKFNAHKDCDKNFKVKI